jgi:peptidoglycan/xylan/chitin deacetylase (PgdA/CDA1 family)
VADRFLRSDDERRTARLLFAHELETHDALPSELDRPEVAEAVRWTHVPSWVSREIQRRAQRDGRLTYLAGAAAPYAAAREAVLGERAGGDPRLLIRVDEFPYYGAYDDPDGWARTFEVFHADALRGTPYLLSVLAAVARDPLDPRGRENRPLADSEQAALHRARADGVAFALHGYDHRTRRRSSRARSELAGLRGEHLDELLDRGLQTLASLQIEPRAFVPPYNRFDARQYPILAKRFDIVAGGPESVRRIGWHRTPQVRADAVYLPAYPPLYGRASEMLETIETLAERRWALWVPVVLHLSWEAADEWQSLVRLVERVGHLAVPWERFYDALDVAR